MLTFDIAVFVFAAIILKDFVRIPGSLYITTSVMILVFGLIALYLKGNYKIREFNITVKNTYLLFEGVLFAHIIPLVHLLRYTDKIEAIKYIILSLVTVFVSLRIYRALFHYWLFKIKKPKKILILGTDKRAVITAKEIRAKRALKMEVAGFVTENETDETIFDENIPVYKNPESITNIIKENKVNIVVIAQATERITEVPCRTEIYKMPDFYEMMTGKYYVDEKTITELYYGFVKRRSYFYDFMKRVADITGALMILIPTLPVLLYIAIRVKLTDGGNPVYTQSRVGKDGKVFKCYKLRTMYVNDYVPKNVKEGGYADNQDSDDRVIPFCRFVRRARFDEIPQMINILKGEMSLVGPRTEWEDLVNIYSKEIPYYKCRMWVKTGWTGWAQIHQGHCITNDDIAEKLQYDLYYLKHRNILWEIGILVEAIFLAVGGRHK